MRGRGLCGYVPTRRKELLVYVRPRSDVRILLPWRFLKPHLQRLDRLCARLPRRQLQPDLHGRHQELHAHWLQTGLLAHVWRRPNLQLELRHHKWLLSDEMIRQRMTARTLTFTLSRPSMKRSIGVTERTNER